MDVFLRFTVAACLIKHRRNIPSGPIHHRRHVRHRCRGTALHRDAHRDAIFVEDRNFVLVNHPGGDHPAFCLPVLLIVHGTLGAGSENVHHWDWRAHQRNADHEKKGFRKLRNAGDNHHTPTNHAKDKQHGARRPSLIFRLRLCTTTAHTCRHVCEDQLVVEGGHWCDG